MPIALLLKAFIKGAFRGLVDQALRSPSGLLVLAGLVAVVILILALLRARRTRRARGAHAAGEFPEPGSHSKRAKRSASVNPVGRASSSRPPTKSASSSRHASKTSSR